ncbi:MAG: hypothetical protein V3T14_09450 [Myxococcota bacterium]
MTRILVYLVLGTVVGLPQPAWAIGSFSPHSTDLVNATTIVSSASIAVPSGLTFGTVTIGTVSLAIQLQEMGTSLQSPHHNALTITNGTQNSMTVASNLGLVSAQQTAGGANVTLAVNSVIVGAGGLAATTTPSISIASENDPTLTLTLLANPSFTTLNSFPVAQTLLLREAFVTHTVSSAGPTSAIAIDIVNVGVTEFSPHHNAGQTTTGMNSAGISGNHSLVSAQQQAGFANVDAAINTIIASSGSAGTGGISF